MAVEKRENKEAKIIRMEVLNDFLQNCKKLKHYCNYFNAIFDDKPQNDNQVAQRLWKGRKKIYFISVCKKVAYAKQ
ncbi:hypothetical protein CBP51_03485 [Cellvibrio mixtus]|uniref:Uncharacterized protein n=1 Tax=Cellvibrio mixtus TaxID=39650 RepID=A0A266Q918_9GAMM|nr:hypothetical protein CBP51_03485 [Cellvibrio mixtus]